MEVIKGLEGASTEMVERSKTIFFPGDPAERVYLIRRGAVRLSRVYESGEEITVALLRENSLFGVLSLLTGHRSDRFYHAIAFTRVEMITAPANSRCISGTITLAGPFKQDSTDRNNDRNSYS